MKKIIGIAILSTFSLSSSYAEKVDLTKKLETLNVPSDKVTPLISEDKLYAVNKRYSSLNKRHEITVSGAKNFNADSHIETENASMTYRFHWNDTWSVGYRYSEYQNNLSSAGEQLFDSEKLLPDTDYALKSTEGFVNFNTVYGKLRLTQDTIVYFDQYITLGYGNIALAAGETRLATVDLGFSFWIGKHASLRIGARNEFYEQQKLNGADDVHNVLGYFEMGYLFGEGATI